MSAPLRLRSGVLAVLGCSSFAASGCMFLVDFDELQQGVSEADAGPTMPPDPGGGGGGAGGDGSGVSGSSSGGTATNGGMATNGGTPGSGGTVTELCPNDCDDGVLCTVDTCTPSGCTWEPIECVPSHTCMSSACVDGVCVETPLSGTVPDGFETVILSETAYKTELVAADGRFFSSIYGVFQGVNDLYVGAFDAEGTFIAGTQSLAPGLRDAPCGTPPCPSYEVASPGALTVDLRSDLQLNVYVAVRDVSGVIMGDLGEVLRIPFNRDLSVVVEPGMETMASAQKLGSAPSFRFISDRVGPAAYQIPGGDPFAVWPGQLPTLEGTLGLFFQVGAEGVPVATPGTNFIPVPDPIVGLAAVVTDSTPGAVWLTDAAAGGVGAFVGTNQGAPPLELSQCHTDASFLGYSLNAEPTFDDLWTVSWGKTDGVNFLAENTGISCLGTECSDANTACADANGERLRETPDVRSLVVHSLRNPATPRIIDQVIGLASGQGESSTISIIATRLDLDLLDAGQSLGIASVASGASTDGLGWPEIAVLPPDKIAISWIEAAESGGHEVHFARYRICGPVPATP